MTTGFVIWQVFICCCFACTINKQAWIDRNAASRKLASAQESRKNGIVNLGHSPSFELPNQTEKPAIMRPEIGSAVTLSCIMHYPERSDKNNTGKYPIWDHSVLGNLYKDTSFKCGSITDCYICHCKRTVQLGPYYLKWNTVTLEFASQPNRLMSTLHIAEAIQFFAGLYTCTERNPHNVSTITSRILMSPLYQPKDVFVPAMQNVTARKGQAAEFHCYTQFELFKGTDKDYSNRFIWYHEKGILYAPKTHPFSVLKIDAETLGSDYKVDGILSEKGTCSCYSTLTIHNTSPVSAGRVECWFQIDPFLDEWLIQSAHLIVHKEN